MIDILPSHINVADMGFTINHLDRADSIRRNADLMHDLQSHPLAKYMLFSDLKPIFDISGHQPKPLWFSYHDLPALKETVLLGLSGDIPHFAAAVHNAAVLPGKALETRSAAMQMAVDDTGVMAQARSMLAWHENHQHCAKCGATTTSGKGGYVRTCDREVCKAEHFPRTDPAAIMLVTDGNRCLLGRQSAFPPRMYSALAGFLEPGETLEDCVRREVWEEAGVKVGAVRYIASQPWPFPSSLMIGCFAEALTTAIKIDTEELEDARWFTLDEIEASLAGAGPLACPPPIAIAHHLLRAWVAVKCEYSPEVK